MVHNFPFAYIYELITGRRWFGDSIRMVHIRTLKERSLSLGIHLAAISIAGAGFQNEYPLIHSTQIGHILAEIGA